MKNFIFILFFFIFIGNVNGQKWKIYLPAVNNQYYCGMQINSDSTINILSNTSFEDHVSTEIDKDGNIIQQRKFKVPMPHFRPYSYYSGNNGKYFVLCRSNVSANDYVNLIKFDKNGVYYWSTVINDNDYDLRPTNFGESNNSIITLGMAQSYLYPQEGYKLFLFEYNNEGLELKRLFIDSPGKYVAGIRAVKLNNRNYLILEARVDDLINYYGSIFCSDYHLDLVSGDGILIKRVKLPFLSGDGYNISGLKLFEDQNYIIVGVGKSIYKYDLALNQKWETKLDFSILDLKCDGNSILVTGENIGSYKGKFPVFQVIDLNGKINLSKTYDPDTRFNSSNRASSILKYGKGYLFSGLRRVNSDYSVYVIKTDEKGSINNIDAQDIFTKCTDTFFNPDSIDDFLVNYSNSCSESNITNQFIGKSQGSCNFCNKSAYMDHYKWILTDDCGVKDSAVQIIYYVRQKPEVNCCNFEILDQNETGAFLHFDDFTFNAPCVDYYYYRLDSLNIPGDIFLPYGDYTINFAFIDYECKHDSIYLNYRFSVVKVDSDNDGYYIYEDCDDDNALVNPGQIEIPYDGLDNDCDTLTYDDDLDRDGYNIDEDCDDNNALVNPGQIEIPYDGLDNDCDTLTYDDDLDRDGYNIDEDCDDDNAMVNPGQIEIPYDGLDNDCDTLTYDDDLDRDGYNIAEDCDDDNAMVNPGQIEIPYDGLDNDCDTLTYDDDLDRDGYNIDVDCDDENPDIHPGAEEIPDNGIDEDCDGKDLITGTKELERNNIYIYPNPAGNAVFICNTENSQYLVTLLNLQGEKVEKLLLNTNKLELYNIKQGIYLLKIEVLSSKTKLIKKLVIIK